MIPTPNERGKLSRYQSHSLVLPKRLTWDEIERVARANPQSASDLPDGTPGYAVSQPRRQ